MVQIIEPSPRQMQAAKIGEALGIGIGKQAEQSQLANLLFGDQSNQYSDLSSDALLQAAKLQQAQQIESQKLQQKEQEQLQKLAEEMRESQLLAKVRRGETLTEEEEASLSPTSQRALINRDRPTFEPRSEALEAERVAKLADEIENAYNAAKTENLRLDRMEELSKKGGLSTPLMVNTLEKIGLPLGILSNPDSEEYAKLEADFLRDVSKVFPGGRINIYEIKSYMKTIPSLMNTKEGRQAIMRNKRLMNKAAEFRYQAYKDILKENDGRKPQNMGILIEERIGNQMADIEMEFRNGIQQASEKFQTPIPMIDPQGRKVNIPPNRIQEAMEAGATFR